MQIAERKQLREITLGSRHRQRELNVAQLHAVHIPEHRSRPHEPYTAAHAEQEKSQPGGLEIDYDASCCRIALHELIVSRPAAHEQIEQTAHSENDIRYDEEFLMGARLSQRELIYPL